MSITGFSFPTAIRFGPGARREVAQHLREQDLTRPLIVTDRAPEAAQIPRLVEVALADICHRTNPRPCTAADFQRLFEAAF